MHSLLVKLLNTLTYLSLVLLSEDTEGKRTESRVRAGKEKCKNGTKGKGFAGCWKRDWQLGIRDF